MVHVTLVGIVCCELEVPIGTKLIDVVNRYCERFSTPIVVAKVNGILCELSEVLESDCSVELLDLTFPEGLRVYERGVTFLFIRAARELFPGCRITMEHHVSNGIYGEIYCDDVLTVKDFERIERRMSELVSSNEPFVCRRLRTSEAVELFQKNSLHDKVRLLKNYCADYIDVYSFGPHLDTFYGLMPPSSGCLTMYKVKSYMPGFILIIPHYSNPTAISTFIELKKLSTVFYETEKWGRILGVGDVGALNEMVEAGLSGDLVRISEALHEKKIAQMADAITSDIERLKLVLVAGPSSSGKTTFAQRLMVQLRVNGLKPVSISLDDYFVSRGDTPIDEDGKPDFEALEAIDIELFNEHLQRLIQGEPIDMPTFNFISGMREYRGRQLRIEDNQPIIIEGIHGLNDRLTETIPTGSKYRIYVSALATINLDDHTRIPTTDVRLLRRVVRDSRFRSHDAQHTIEMWPSVRRGELKNIFPHQENADSMFNSSLSYELALMRRHAEPLLEKVPKGQRGYSDADRLMGLLSFFLPIDDRYVPQNSIIREFCGNSCFYE